MGLNLGDIHQYLATMAKSLYLTSRTNTLFGELWKCIFTAYFSVLIQLLQVGQWGMLTGAACWRCWKNIFWYLCKIKKKSSYIRDPEVIEQCFWYKVTKSLPFCLCTPLQCIWNKTIEMWLKCKHSALIQKVLQIYGIHRLGITAILYSAIPFSGVQMY